MRKLPSQYQQSNAVYVGRPSKWGNPFHIGVHGTRAACVGMYKEYVQQQPELMNALHELKGKDLVCWCAPLACHADILLELANKKEE